MNARQKEWHVLQAIKDGARTGAEIAAATKMLTGSLYPVLTRLERRGELSSEWEAGNYPRRRLYSLTAGRTGGKDDA